MCWLACAWLACAGGFAGDDGAARLDVGAQVDGAQVWVDGEARGTAGANSPCVVAGLAPGRHHVHVEAPAFAAADAVVDLEAGGYGRTDFALEEEKGLILVKTRPAGADVRCNGVSLGTTPLLVTSLASDTSHALELSLNGHRAKRIAVRTDGRRPLVVEEALSLDSGILKCLSEPAGATVFVNGVERGVTPVEVARVPKGRATVKFALDGYRDETRDDLHVAAGDVQTLSVTLRPRPARLTVVSTPEQARVFVDDAYQGKTPATVESLAPGPHKIRLELAGHAPVTRDVALARGGDATEEFRLESVLGRLEVVSMPPGAKVLVDGKAVGTTRGVGGDAARSQVLALENLPAGEHAVLVRLDGHQDVSRRVVVKAKDTGRIFVRLPRIFQPDTEVETIQGLHRGVLVERDFFDNLTLEVAPGVRQTFRKDEIRKVTPLAR